MAVFLSKNNTEPYQIIDTINYPNIDLVEYGTESVDEFITYQDYFYVIFEQGEVHSNVVVEVSLDYSFGVALDISATDLVGNPIRWGTRVELGNVDASSNTQKYLLLYRWRVINNIYLVKPGEKVAYVRVYADD
jgi:hypothetical protein